MNPLIKQLRIEFEVEVDPVRRAELVARIACHQARAGAFDDAKRSIEELRQVYGDGRNGSVTVWIMLAEGLVHLYSELSPFALDRIARAQLLSVAMRYPTLIALASAWKAHIEFETSNFSAMKVSLRTALLNAAESNKDAHIRIAIVLSNAFMVSGNHSLAQKWFLKGRECALGIGDRASIEALLYNRTAFRISWLRAAYCCGAASESDLHSLRREIESSKNLENLLGASVLNNQTELWDARLQLIDGRFKEAVDAFQSVRVKGPFASYNFSQSFVDLEIAFCLLRLGRTSDAIAIFQPIDLGFIDSLDVDESLVVSWMLLRMSELDEVFGASEARLAEFEVRRTVYANSREKLELELSEFSGL